MLVENKIAVITGAAQGIGKSIALCLAGNGADIIVSDINESALKGTAEKIESMGRKALALNANVTNPREIEEGLKLCLDKFNRIDILVNNAGITRDGLIVRMKQSDWEQVLSTNLTGAFNWTKAVVKCMIKQKGGCIVNIASIIGLIGNTGQANYSASKAGILGLMKSSARELAPWNIRVNAVAPGFIATQMTEKLPDKIKEQMLSSIPLKKFGEPDEVAKAVLFLVSDMSSYITGQVLNIDGGMVM